MQLYVWIASNVCVVPETGEIAFNVGFPEIVLHARAHLHCVLVKFGALA